MNGVRSEQDAATFCAEQLRSHDFSRYASTLFVEPPARRALVALYAFNAEIARIRDQVSQPLPGEIRLQWWTDLLTAAGHGDVEGNPVAAELLRAVRIHDLPVERLARLIEEHQFDLYNDPMPTMAALEGYLNDTSSALLALASDIMGYRSDEIDHLARHAGLAQGMARLLAALPLDASRRQLFVPLQLLELHGGGIEEVFTGRETPTVRAALSELIAEARAHLKTAFALLADLPPPARPVFLPLALVRRDLERLARIDSNAFVPHQASRFRVLWTLWRASRSRAFKR